MRRIGYKLGLRLRQIQFIRCAIDDHASLQGFDSWMLFRCILGLLLIAISNLICWPLIGVLSGMSVHQKKPLIAILGGPAVYGITFICCAIGMALAGGKFARIFLRWRARIWVELLLSQGNQAKESRSTKPRSLESMTKIE